MIKDKPLSNIVLDFCSSVKNIRVDYNKQKLLKMADQTTENKLKAMRTTPIQSRMLQEWNIPSSSADTENSFGVAWSGLAISKMLPDSIPDNFNRPAQFAGDRIWYKGVSPIFNGPDALQNLIDMVLWLIRSGRGDQLLIDPQPETPWNEFLVKKNEQINTKYRQERMSEQQNNKEENERSGWKRN